MKGGKTFGVDEHVEKMGVEFMGVEFSKGTSRDNHLVPLKAAGPAFMPETGRGRQNNSDL